MTRTLTAVPDTATPTGGRWWKLAPIEARLLLRRRTTMLGLLSGPAIMILLGVVLRPSAADGWGTLAALTSLLGMLISVYVTTATVFTIRRETGALSRLRTTELTGSGIVAATGAPLLVAGVGQALLVCGVYVALGSPLPVNPVLLGVALGGSAVFCVAAGALTSTFSRSAEGVQYTAMPLVLAAAVGANLLAGGVAGPVGAALLWAPGVPVVDLVMRAWSGFGPAPDVAGVPAVLIGLLSLAVWIAVAVLGSAARWRWTPRG